MRVLAVAGTGALALTLPLAGLISVMLAIVTLSYRQTIKAYPKGASSYIVASDNLGSGAGVLAAAALLIGYVVTVAVSVSAGVAALSSMFPAIFELRVIIGVGLVVLLMVGNLRGIRESGTIFMIPTYAYIVVMLGIIGYGVARTLAGDVAPFEAPAAWEGVEQGAQALGLFLILRAFSQGAVALTGVEAISDGVPAFKPPEWKNARTTLTWAAIVFAILFLGIAYLLVIDRHPAGSVRRADHPLPPGPTPDRRRGGPGHRPDRDRPDPRSRRQHELRRLPAPLLVPCARRIPAAAVRIPRRAARLHDRHRGAVADGDRPDRRVQRQRQRADPALHARRVHRLHPLPGRHAGALVASAGARLAAGPRDQRPRGPHHRRGGPRRRDQQLLPGLVAGDRPRPAPHDAPARDPRPLPEDGPRACAGPHSRRRRRPPRDRS